MPITRRSEYGLRAMVLLGEQVGEERLSATELSRREAIPIKYLEQILAALRKAGLVTSQAGAKGGYRLARPAAQITIGCIVRALDGPLDPGPIDAAPPPSAGQPEARLWPLWRRLGQAMREVLDGTTLDQLTFTTCPPVAPQPAPPEGEEVDEPPPERRLMYWI